MDNKQLRLKAIDIERLENTSPAVGLLLDPGAIQAVDAWGTWTCPDTATCCETAPATCTCPDSATCPETWTCPATDSCDCGSDTCCCGITSCITGPPSQLLNKVVGIKVQSGVNVVEF